MKILINLFKKFSFLVLLLILESIFISNTSQAQNTVSADFSWYGVQIRKGITYNQNLYSKRMATNSVFKISTSLGFGVGDNGDGLDRRLQEHYGYLGFQFGLEFFEKHHLETGINFYRTRTREGYLSYENEPWEYDSRINLSFGYKYKIGIASLRIFVLPVIEKQEDFNPNSGITTSYLLVIFPGISCGIKF